jgi:hypothetical protein
LSGEYELTADITLTDWKPIGDDITPFTGSFNGKNKTITLSSFYTGADKAKYLGIFAYTDGAAVSNATIAYGVPSITGTVATDTYIGTAAAYAKNTKFTNITVSGILNLKNVSSVTNVAVYGGGIAGYVVDAEFTNCVSSVALTITGNHNTSAGGIAGAAGNTGVLKTQFISCSSTGAVTVNWQSGGTGNYGSPYAGGIIGNSVVIYNGPGCLFENCYTTGAIVCSLSQYPYAGGIAGGFGNGQIRSSYTTGNVSATSTSGAYIGGIGGNNTNGALIENSYSKGNITLTGKGYVGGIAGQNGSNGSIVRYCYATGTITSTDSSASVGGIAGQNYSHADNDVKANAALNSAITAAVTTTKAHRVVGEKQGAGNAKVTNNIANSTMTIIGFTVSDATAGGLDGADTTATPDWSVYFDTLGWSSSVWKTTLVNGYPVLAWQQ